MNNAEIIAKGQKYCLNVFNRLPIAMVRGEGSYVLTPTATNIWILSAALP